MKYLIALFLITFISSLIKAAPSASLTNARHNEITIKTPRPKIQSKKIGKVIKKIEKRKGEPLSTGQIVFIIIAVILLIIILAIILFLLALDGLYWY